MLSFICLVSLQSLDVCVSFIRPLSRHFWITWCMAGMALQARILA